MPTILLVRHATTATTGKRLYGRKPGVRLDERGLGEAAATARLLESRPIAAVYSSPMERARQTATAVARPHGLKVVVRAGLNEVDYGDWTDRPLAQLRRRKDWTIIQQTPSRFSFPGGESLRGAQARVADAVEAIAADHSDTATVVAVTHADLIRMLIAHYSGTPLDHFQRLVVAPASVTSIHLAADAEPLILSTNVVPQPSRTEPDA